MCLLQQERPLPKIKGTRFLATGLKSGVWELSNGIPRAPITCTRIHDRVPLISQNLHVYWKVQVESFPTVYDTSILLNIPPCTSDRRVIYRWKALERYFSNSCARNRVPLILGNGHLWVYDTSLVTSIGFPYTIGKFPNSAIQWIFNIQWKWKLWETKGTRTCIRVHVMGATALRGGRYMCSACRVLRKITMTHGIQPKVSVCLSAIRKCSGRGPLIFINN